MFLKNHYYISHVVNFGASLKFDDVMLTRYSFICATPLDQKVIEMLSVYSTSRPSPLHSLAAVPQTTTLFMISTGQVTNKKSAIDELHH